MRFEKILALAAFLALPFLAPAYADKFSFVALGDTAYNPPDDYPKYEALIGKINAAKPAFSIHVGDTWGIQDCREPQQREVLGFFQRYQGAVIYTPGDNEWVDCIDPEAARLTLETKGNVPAILKARPDLAAFFTFDAQFSRRFADDGLARLGDIRRVFFSKPMSLGQKPIPLIRQADVSDFHDYVENARWEKGGIEFATINVPGSGNGFMINDEARAREAVQRMKANVAWLKALFQEAKMKSAKAVVIALQASLFENERSNDDFSGQKIRGGDEGPYYWIAFAIRDLATAYGKPVLVINGDFHDFLVDKPFRIAKSEEKPAKYDNITRLQVYGAPDLRAVKVDVDTDTPWIFSFSPLY